MKQLFEEKKLLSKEKNGIEEASEKLEERQDCPEWQTILSNYVSKVKKSGIKNG